MSSISRAGRITQPSSILWPRVLRNPDTALRGNNAHLLFRFPAESTWLDGNRDRQRKENGELSDSIGDTA